MSFLLASAANAVLGRAFEARMSLLAAEIALCFHRHTLSGQTILFASIARSGRVNRMNGNWFDRQAMIVQFCKTAVIERKNACIRTLQSHLSPMCAGPHGHENLWIAMALYRIGRLRLKGGGECGASIGCARVCSRVLLDWRFFVPFLAYLFVAHSVATSLWGGTCLCLACSIW